MPAPRVCTEPGCPVLTTTGRCDEHRRAVDRARGTRQQRGYDSGHDQLRRHWTPKVRRGTVHCWRCEQLIGKTEAWDLGHDDEDRTKHRGPEHAHCNRRAGALARHAT